MDEKRIQEIQAIIQSLREAEKTGKVKHGLFPDARYALLELLDEYKMSILKG